MTEFFLMLWVVLAPFLAAAAIVIGCLNCRRWE